MRKNENINDFNNSLQKITYGVKFLYDSDNTPTSTKSNEKERKGKVMENTTKENKEKILNMIEDKWLRRQLEDMLDELSFRNGFDIFKEEEKIGWIDVKDNGDIYIKVIIEDEYKPLITAFVAINASYIRETLDKRLGK